MGKGDWGGKISRPRRRDERRMPKSRPVRYGGLIQGDSLPQKVRDHRDKFPNDVELLIAGYADRLDTAPPVVAIDSTEVAASDRHSSDGERNLRPFPQRGGSRERE